MQKQHLRLKPQVTGTGRSGRWSLREVAVLALWKGSLAAGCLPGECRHQDPDAGGQMAFALPRDEAGDSPDVDEVLQVLAHAHQRAVVDGVGGVHQRDLLLVRFANLEVLESQQWLTPGLGGSLELPGTLLLPILRAAQGVAWAREGSRASLSCPPALADEAPQKPWGRDRREAQAGHLGLTCSFTC